MNNAVISSSQYGVKLTEIESVIRDYGGRIEDKTSIGVIYDFRIFVRGLPEDINNDVFFLKRFEDIGLKIVNYHNYSNSSSIVSINYDLPF